jgi:O-antigen/teichoic acid export membrane protein
VPRLPIEIPVFAEFAPGSAEYAVEALTHKSKSLRARIVAGSVVLLSGSGMTIATNLLYNIVVAQFLGPRGFGQATVVYTLLILLSAVMLALQIVSSKVVAQQPTPEGKAAVYRAFHHTAWGLGLTVALALYLFRGQISDYLNLPDPALVALLAIGAAFYIPLGPRRGYAQGTFAFRSLATNLVIEGAVRLVGSYLLIVSGFGVRGVIAANAAAVAAAYFVLPPKLVGRIPNPLNFRYAFRETAQATVFYAGQMLIGNCGIVMVNHFFAAREAGIYAAVAMVGRVIFTMTSAVVNTTFPLVAGTSHENRRDLRVIATSLLLVLGSGAGLALALCAAPDWVWTHLFGTGFRVEGRYGLSYLLALYALAIVIYSLSAVIITFEMSYKIANTSWVQLALSGLLVGAIYLFHDNLRDVVLVQLVLMALLLVMVAVPFLVNALTGTDDVSMVLSCRPMQVIRRITEDEAIAEFLKSEFTAPAFKNYQETLGPIVAAPDLCNAKENAARRALLFLRHLALWKELPQGTQWYEVTLNEDELENVRVFPRAQWRKLARGNFAVTTVTERLEDYRQLLDTDFVAKIDAIEEEILRGKSEFGAVILIGTSENEPLTVLDGNHRLVAAMLAAPRRLEKLKFLCGLSPRMRECCWYKTNLPNLFRYGRNILAHTQRDPEAELAVLLKGFQTLERAEA